MSSVKIELGCRLLKELYGDMPTKVGAHLIVKGASPLRLICQYTKLTIQQVRKVLWILIQQNIVQFSQNAHNVIEYKANINSVLCRLRYPKYIYCAKTLYGDAAELLVEELLHEGQSVMDVIVQRVTDKLNEALETAGHAQIQASLVRDKFNSLVRTHFLQRCVEPVKDKKDRAVSLHNPAHAENLYVLPPMDVDGSSTSKRKRVSDDSQEPRKRLKTDAGDSSTEFSERVYWQVNFDRFHQHFRDQSIIDAVARKIDKKASEIIRTMLRLSETKTDPSAETSLPLSFTEIFQAISKDHGITKLVLEHYLSIIADDSVEFITKVGDSGGGMYIVNIFKILTALCKAHVESVVQERFGSKCMRIFRVLLLKKQVEQKQIEDYAMSPAKEVKELLYSLLADNLVSFTEVSKTIDHAPSRTYYLFNVDLNNVARMILERSYSAISNAMTRRVTEVNTNKRLLDKQERVDAIITTLEQGEAGDAQKEDIEQMITPAEKAQLEKVKKSVNKLDNCEIQLDDTVFLLETYLSYTMKPPPPKVVKTIT